MTKSHTDNDQEYGLDPLLFHTRGANDRHLSDRKGRCQCGENRAAAMTTSGSCYACLLRKLGKPVIEGHHLFGRSVPIIVDLPANEHRVLDALRGSRYRLLKEPSADTLANIAALLLQFVELAEIQCAAVERRRAPPWTGALAEVLIDRGRDALETLLFLSGHLREIHGQGWEPRSWAP